MSEEEGRDADVIGIGSRVTLHYTLSLEDGMVADSTREGEPLRFTLGDGSLIEGLELALLGLRAGERQCLAIPPQTGFGFRDPEQVHELPRRDFPAHIPLEEGLIIGFSTPSGEEVPGAVLAVGKDSVTVDFNHPLAGHEVTFDVEILAVENDGDARDG